MPQGGAPLKEVWEVEEGTELHSMPFSKPLSAILAGHTWYQLARLMLSDWTMSIYAGTYQRSEPFHNINTQYLAVLAFQSRRVA